MQTAAAIGFPDPQLKAGAIIQIQTEIELLSHALLLLWNPLYKNLFILSSDSLTDRLSSDFPNGMFWTEDENVSLIDEKIPDEWGTLALIWGITCPIRPIAFRSLQVFRSLMPVDLAQPLCHLPNTATSGQELNLHPFTVEMIITLSPVAKSGNADRALPLQLLSCAVACLSTPVEAEFLQLLDLLDCLLDKLDLNDPYDVEVLIANEPENFTGSGGFGLQSL
ncbi:cell morphogenesis [Pyrrhoderma noxium]|uniref:Cell morphogenesis n=1 Tax=Pyrrhoderma noxium TaxID=2282107 RepID=A0A286UHH4_9AGAM|nr:cell morphogenesis [Pyrrhoderma noxium]